MELSRREVLAMLLGAGAGAACLDRPRAPRYPGQLYGPSMRAGHQLRDASAVPEPTEESRAQVVIVGGGVSGLSCAWRLRKLGVEDVVVLELEDRAGGTATWGQGDGVVSYPWGAHYLPCPPATATDLVELLRETGSIVRLDPLEFAETHLVGAPKERVFVGGAWSEGLYPAAGASAADLAELHRFRAEIAAWVARVGSDGKRAFALPIDSSSADPDIRALDGVSMDDWLTRAGYRSPRLRWFVEYGCRDDYGTELAYTSAWAALHYHCARTEVGSADSAEVLTWPEGNGRLVRQLAQGVRVIGAQVVRGVEQTDAAVTVTALDRNSGRTVSWRAPHVVLATPSFLRRFLVPEAPPWSPRSSAWIVANLHLRDRPRSRGFPTSWDNVIYDSKGLGYVVATHQALLDRGPTVWTYYLPLLDADDRAARQRLLGLERDSIVDAIVAELSRAHVGLPELISRVDVWRWGHAMARPDPGSIWSPQRAQACQAYGRVHFAHSDLSSVGLFEEAFAHGNRAAREVASAT